MWGTVVILLDIMISAITYNPMNATGLRMQSIQHEFRFYNVIGLCGTARMTEQHEAQYRSYRLKNHTVFDWGWQKRTPGINKSCGVTLLIDRATLPNKCLNAVYSPPRSMQGRAGAVRYKTASQDLCIVAMYLAPATKKVTSAPCQLQQGLS